MDQAPPRDPSTELIPLRAPTTPHTFDLTLRGYDRRQVDDALDQLESDIAVAIADRDAAVSRLGALERAVEELQAELTQNRRQVEASSTPTLAGLGARVEMLLRLAEEEATETRARAEQDAARLRAAAEQEVGTLRASADGIVEQAEERRRRIEGDFETALAARRQSADAEDRERREAAEAEAAGIVADARREADRLAQDAGAHADALVQAARRDADAIVADARRQADQLTADSQARVDELAQQRNQITSQLRALRELLTATATAAPDPDATNPQVTLPGAPDGPSGARRVASVEDEPRG